MITARLARPPTLLTSIAACRLACAGFAARTKTSFTKKSARATAGKTANMANNSNAPHGSEVHLDVSGCSRCSEGGASASDASPRKMQRNKSWAVSIDSLADLNIPLNPLALIRRVVKESVVLFALAVRLWSFLGLGWRWTVNFYRLVLYAILLMPGFIQMIAFYFFSPRVKRSIPYGRKPRQRLDLYFPEDLQHKNEPAPVVIFVTGGAWTIGYKAWGSLLGKRLSEQGILLVCLDYRNFPQGNALDMLEDVNTGIFWVCSKISRYGGDLDNIYLCGQSAGGQLAAMALIRQAEQAARGEAVAGAAPVWHPMDVRAFIGISGAYDLEGLAEHLHRRGLYKNLFEHIMTVDGKVATRFLSPLNAVVTADAAVRRFLPRVVLLHGTADKSVPHNGSQLFAQALKDLGVCVTCQLFDGKTHTQFLLEDALGGGRDVLAEAIIEEVMGAPSSKPISHPAMCPRVLCNLAGWICPF